MSGDNTAYDSGSENFQKNFSGSDSSGNTDETCPICCSPLLLGEETVICSDCQTAYHKECWEENHGCAVYGCRSAPDKNVSEEFNDLKKTGMQCCSRCQTLLREEMRFCPVCGQQVNLVSVSDFFLFRIGQTLGQKLLLLWQDVVCWGRRLKPYWSFSWRSYLSCLSAYACFRGKTSRRDFINYIVVESVIFLLLGDGILNFLFCLGTFLPTIGVVVRRLHDAGLSAGYLCFVPLLPFLLLVPSENVSYRKTSFTTGYKTES